MKTESDFAVLVVFAKALVEALTDVDGIDPESVAVHDLARRTIAEAALKTAEAIPGATLDVQGVADDIREAGFDYTMDPNEANPILAELLGEIGV